jgi:hypothetical protein
MMDPARHYLRLDPGYCEYLGGLRWSASEDAVEYEDGMTFAFHQEIALFLEGFGGRRPLIHFSLVLHLLDLLRNTRRQVPAEAGRLRRLFAAAGGSLRNAGALCAALDTRAPPFPFALDVIDVCQRLRNPTMPIRWYVGVFHDTVYAVERAPLGPVAFERTVLSALGAYSDQELTSWFRSGRGPVKGAGDALGRGAADLPRPTLAGALAILLDRPRLAGARRLVGQLVSAPALPPRRLARPELPVGGYADVATRGQLGQIVPSQFALDEEDFFRRFAERELLYFRREEPHAHAKLELVALLDQGVRTWGDVRLVLAAALLALGKQADRQGARFLLAATSSGGELTDPLEAGSEALAELVEASDLSPNPGLALERVLEQPAALARDVVLLTHPRNLRESDVAAAARRAAPDVRLFGVALDGAGEADLCELRHGTPVRLRHFRVDLAEPIAPTPAERPRPAEDPDAWHGAIEPVGFPFRFGIGSRIGKDHFDFDAAGEWLLTASKHGMLHAWKLEDNRVEILPRGMVGGRLLRDVEAVVGVAGGFAVIGKIGGRFVLMHYDLAAQTCKAHPLCKALPGSWSWHYAAEYYAVVGWSSKAWGVALDLTTGAQFLPHEDEAQESRAKEAYAAWQRTGLSAGRLPVRSVPPPAGEEDALPYLYLDPHTGKVYVRGVGFSWPPFVPLVDGRPALKGATAGEGQWRGNTLALAVDGPGSRKHEKTVYLFRGVKGSGLGTLLLAGPGFGFVLSRDGNLLARHIEGCRVEITATAGAAGAPFRTVKGEFSPQRGFLLGDRWLLVRSGRGYCFLLRWDRATFEVCASRRNMAAFLDEEFGRRSTWYRGTPGTTAGLPGFLKYDPERFTVGAEGPVVVAGDRYGQVAVFDRRQRLVCMFFTLRQRFAAWMPDGSRLGPGRLTGSADSAAAAHQFYEALREAWEQGRCER